MKKLALALVASTVAISAASANINTGFYLGAAVGYGATTAKGALQGISGTIAHGDTAANVGIHAGYGWVQNCTYFGGEVAYTFENTKINNTFGGLQQTFKRNGYFGAALRAGYLFTPTTMAYIRLGGNWGKWKLDDKFTGFAAGTGSKNRFSFTPGFGIETAVQKNVFLRAEYTYEFGPSVTANNNGAAALARSVTFSRVRSQSAKIGLSYKF
jgi:outer membrane immunogenic protein